MKTVTIREAQHNLARLLKVVESGEPVEIVRRTVPVARLVPVANVGPGKDVDWTEHAGRMAAVWGDVTVKGVDELVGELRGDR